MTTADEQNLKALFAIELLKTPNDPFKAAQAVQSNVGLALRIANEWPNDAFVLSEKQRLIEENGARSFLPTKEEYARAVYDLASCESLDPKDRFAGYRLYGEIMSFIEKPNSVNVNNTLIQQNRVMVVNNTGTNAEWEAKLAEQQRRLVEISAG